MLDAFRRFTEQWVTRHGNQLNRAFQQRKEGQWPGLASPPAVRVGSRTGQERKGPGPRVRPQAARAGSRRALVATLRGSQAVFYRRQQETTRVFSALCGHMVKYSTF